MKGFLKSIFSRESVNTDRQLELDIARGLAVLFMILVHVTGEFLDESANGTVFAKVVDFFGCVPAAPVFMFLMGVGFIYSKNQHAGKLFKRGVLFFFLGYVMNFFRGFLPLFIGSRLGYYPLNIDGLEWYHFLVEVDVFQLAGLSMIFISLLKAIRINLVFYPLIAIFAGIVSPYLWGLKTGVTAIDVFAASVFGGTNYTFHPFFSWVFYPLMGASFGWLLIRTKNKRLFYFYASIISITIIVLGFVYYYQKPGIDFGIVTGDVYNYFHHGILSNLIFVASIVCWLSFWNFTAHTIPKLLKSRLLFWSKTVTIIYFVHWIIIGWCSFLVFDTFSIIQTVIAMLVLIIFTDRITDLYIKIRERLSECEEIDIPAVRNI